MHDNQTELQLIRDSDLFDDQWYLEHYSDVSAVGLDPVEHYLRFGAAMARNPGPAFDAARYLEDNPDIAAAGINPLVHYLQFGLQEGRTAEAVKESLGRSQGASDAAARALLDEVLVASAATAILPAGRLAPARDSDLRPGIEVPARHRRLGATADKEALVVAWVINQHDKMTHQYRVHNYASELSRRGVHAEVVMERELLECDLDRVDVLVLCRVAADDDMLRTIDCFRASGRPAVFDIDDLVFDPDRIELIRHVAARADSQRDEFRKTMARWRDTLWRCDFATVSTYALKKEVERLGKPALVLPNNISREEEERAASLIAARPGTKPARIRLGYFSGTRTHEHDFAEAAEAIFRILHERDDVELMVVGCLAAAERFREFGDRLIELPLMPHDQMLEQLASLDVNLAPLEPHNAFTHGKSELKLFEAALYEVPSVVSPTASYAAAIVPGRNGLLASNADEWYRAILRLIDDAEGCRAMGLEARRTIASRFLVRNTASEALAILHAAKEGRVRPLPGPSASPMVDDCAIAIVSILYKKREEVVYFLESMRRQSFDRGYEVVLVDDASPDDSVTVVEEFVRTAAALPDSNPNMRVRIIRNDGNRGNCYSRNRAIDETSSELVVVVDADCVFNRDFLAAHFAAHQRGECDVAIGPKGIETSDRPPLSVLGMHDADPSLAVEQARPQDGINQESFVNCVTRNFSVRRDLIALLPDGQLFDERFNYSASPDSGFGWEDVEMGCRLHAWGARIKFLADTASIHVSHPPAVANVDKSYRSLKNFRRLHEKHPLLKLQARQWGHRTYKAILDWCHKEGGELESNPDYRFLERHFAQQRKAPVVFDRARKLRVLTFRWHCSHQYELYHLGHDFTLATGMGTELCERWDWNHRPLPANAYMRRHDRIDPREFDVAILHFDENILHPELCNDKVPADWGATFLRALKEWDLPKVAICHGTPQFRGQYRTDYQEDDLGAVVEDSQRELVDLLGDVIVVCNSHQASAEWGFCNSRTIWHGFSPHDYPPAASAGRGVYAMPSRAMSNRPYYNGWFAYQRIVELLGAEIPVTALDYRDPPVTYAPRTVEWSRARYENYVRAIGAFDVYLNPTMRSPMPRTRGEAMMAGVATVSLRNHDVDRFIQNGVNGFYADSADEMAEQIRFLMCNQAARGRVAAASRLTAMDVFNQDRYLSAWATLLKDVCG